MPAKIIQKNTTPFKRVDVDTVTVDFDAFFDATNYHEFNANAPEVNTSQSVGAASGGGGSGPRGIHGGVQGSQVVVEGPTLPGAMNARQSGCPAFTRSRQMRANAST